jgi:hypothetical protein
VINLPRTVALLLLCAALSVPSAAEAQETEVEESGRSRGLLLIELPAHRALSRVRSAEDTELEDFKTDGCSGGLSAGWMAVADWLPSFAAEHGEVPPWEGCCISHDRLYHSGGPSLDAKESFLARLAADEALRQCVLETGEERLAAIVESNSVEPDSVRKAYQTIADAIYVAVRTGGGPCSGLSWRWGYGYPQCLVLPRDLSD